MLFVDFLLTFVGMKQDIMVYAAPLQGFTEAAWRNAHARVFGGVEAYYAPFVRLEKGDIRNKDRREVSVAQNTVGHLIPQLIASEPEEFETLVRFLLAEGYREVDVNMGCPFPMLTKRGKGSGILPHPDKVAALLSTMTRFPEVTFSVKMRLGWESADEWRALLPLLNDSCVQQVTLHPRLGKQQYKGEVDWDSFRAFYDSCKVPMVYNGDLTNLDKIGQLISDFPRLKGVMLGRGLLADPSLAASVLSGQPMEQSSLYAKVAEMHQLMLEHYERNIEGGEGQLLQKLKTMWEYLLPDMEKKARKAITKSTKLDQYLRNVSAALRSGKDASFR